MASSYVPLAPSTHLAPRPRRDNWQTIAGLVAGMAAGLLLALLVHLLAHDQPDVRRTPADTRDTPEASGAPAH